MFFLIRLAFWLSIVILLLPSSKSVEAPQGPQLATADALSAAGAALSDMRQFCTRQPSACEVGSQAAAAFGQKAQDSAKLIYDFFTEQQPGDAAPTAKPAKPATAASQDTLSAADRAPPYRGPRSRPEQQARRPS
jgi:hypothetical protein